MATSWSLPRFHLRDGATIHRGRRLYWRPYQRPFSTAHTSALSRRVPDADDTADFYEQFKRKFKATVPLPKHLHSSPAHAPSFHTCSACSLSFSSASALALHIRIKHTRNEPPRDATPPDASSRAVRTASAPPASSKHTRSKLPREETPLHAFFQAHEKDSGFRYDRSRSPSASFDALRAHMGWQRGDPVGYQARKQYRNALLQELEVWFGGEDDLTNWHALCRAVGISPLPKTCQRCRDALRGRHVNLVDLIQWARAESGEGEEQVRVFRSVPELAKYCRDTGKWFPLGDVEYAGEKGDGKVVIRHLLRRLQT